MASRLENAISTYGADMAQGLQDKFLRDNIWFYDMSSRFEFLMSDYEKYKENQRSPILITMPKSASRYIANALGSNYNLVQRKFSFGPALQGELIIPNCLVKGLYYGCVLQGHPDPSEHNIALLRKFSGKAILNIRHPAQALKSLWFHFLKLSETRNQSPDHIKIVKFDSHQLVGIPESADLLTLDQFTRFWFPKYIKWANGWLRVIHSLSQSDDFSMSISKYEDFSINPEAEIMKICNFFGLDKSSKKVILPPKTQSNHYREGSRDNYKDFFNLKALEFMSNEMKGEITDFYQITPVS